MDEEYFKQLAFIESSNDPKAYPKDPVTKERIGTAAGLFQFTEDTWEEVVDSLKLDYTLEDRYDPIKSRKVVEKFTDDNKRFLETRLGREVDKGELYLAHFMGRKAALDTLASIDTGIDLPIEELLSPTAIRNNSFIIGGEKGIKSAYDMYNYASTKMGSKSRKAGPRHSLDQILGTFPEMEAQALPEEPVIEGPIQEEEQGLSSEFIQGLNFNPDLYNAPEEEPTATVEGVTADPNDYSFTGDITAFADGGNLEGPCGGKGQPPCGKKQPVSPKESIKNWENLYGPVINKLLNAYGQDTVNTELPYSISATHPALSKIFNDPNSKINGQWDPKAQERINAITANEKLFEKGLKNISSNKDIHESVRSELMNALNPHVFDFEVTQADIESGRKSAKYGSPNRVVPSIDEDIKKFQDRILNTPDKELRELLKKDYSEVNLFNWKQHLPENVGLFEALKYNKKFNKLIDKGYTFAQGGSTGVQSDDGLLQEINTGGTHAENPYGGVPISQNPSGGMNLVEEGEVKVGDYVLSNRSKITKQHIEDLNINEKYEGWTMADAGKDINAPLKDNPFSSMVKKSVASNIQQVVYANDIEKDKMKKTRKSKDKKFSPGGGAAAGGLAALLGGPAGIGISAVTSLLPMLLEGFGPGKDKRLKERNNNTLAANSQFPDGGPQSIGNTLGNLEQFYVNNLLGQQRQPESSLLKSRQNFIDVNSGQNPQTTRISRNQYDGSRPGLHNNPERDRYQDLNSPLQGTTLHGVPEDNLRNQRANFIQQQQMLGDRQSFIDQQQGTGASTGQTNRNTVPPQDLTPQTTGLNIDPQGIATGDQGIETGNTFTGAQQSFLGEQAGITAGESQNEGNNKSGFNANNLLRYAPVAGNIGRLLLGDNEADTVRLDRLTDRFRPQFMDEQSLINPAREAASNTRRALQQNAAGSGSAARTGLLASQLNETRAIADSMFKGKQWNFGQENMRDEFNSKINQFNVGQSNREEQINAQAEGVAQQRKDALGNSILSDIGSIGKENFLGDILKKTTGYGTSGDFTGIANLLEDGGILTNMFNRGKNDPLKKFIKEQYGY